MTVTMFAYDDDTETVAVSVSGIFGGLMTDADGGAVLVPPNTPIGALTPSCAKALKSHAAEIAKAIGAAAKQYVKSKPEPVAEEAFGAPTEAEELRADGTDDDAADEGDPSAE